MSIDLHMAISSEGAVVAEAELGSEDLISLIDTARDRGAELLWVHTNADLSSAGFTRADGYVRLRADVAPYGEHLPALAEGDYAPTLDHAYRGLWGHKHVGADVAPSAAALVLGLYKGSEPIGLCTVFPDERVVDGPGLVPDERAPDNYARLLQGACAVLAGGPIDVDSWGDNVDVIAAYVGLGFTIVEQTAGWELPLAGAGE